MTSLLFLFMSFAMRGSHTMPDVYFPLSPAFTAFSNNKVAILNYKDNVIIVYDFTTQQTIKIDGKGDGPESFEGSLSLDAIDHHIFASVSNKVVKYDFNGNFVESFKLHRAKGSHVTPVSTGGFASYDMAHRTMEDMKLYYFGNKDDEGQLIVSLKNTPITGASQHIQFNPVESQSIFKFSHDKRYAAWREENSNTITIFDFNKGEVSGVITIEDKKIPFSKEWGNKELEELRNTMKQYGTKVEAAFPEYFPPIRFFTFTAENNVLVSCWSSIPEQDTALLFDVHGQPVDAEINDAKTSKHTLSVTEKGYWVYHLDDEDVVHLTLQEKGELAPYISSLPAEECFYCH